MNGTRDISIDIVRGIAITTMVGANMAAEVLAEPHPLVLRLYGSFAAPLFIFIAGSMVSFTSKAKHHHLRYYLLRGGLVVIVGVLIDVLLWRVYPFTSVDVLYLIGVSIPILYLVRARGDIVPAIVSLLIIVATPVLQNQFGYHEHPMEIELTESARILSEYKRYIFQHWLIDGYFPLFPWLAFGLLGASFGSWRVKYRSFSNCNNAFVLTCSAALLVCGAITWRLHPGPLLVRYGYSELFYPPTIGYILTAAGIIGMILYTVDRKPSMRLLRPLRMMGEASLFFYIVHLIVIDRLIATTWRGVSVAPFCAIYVATLIILFVLAYAINRIKVRWKKRPFAARFLLGN